MKIVHKIVIGEFLCGVLVFAAVSYAARAGDAFLRTTVEDTATMRVTALVRELETRLDDRVREWSAYGDSAVLRRALTRSNASLGRSVDIGVVLARREHAWKGTPGDAALAGMPELDDGDLAGDLRARVERRRNRWREPESPSVVVTNRYGAHVAATKRPAHYRYDREGWWQQAMATGRCMADVAPDESTGIPSMVLGVRIDDGDGEPLGVLAVFVDLGLFLDTCGQIAGTLGVHRLALLTKTGGLVHDGPGRWQPLREGSAFSPAAWTRDAPGVHVTERVDGDTGAALISASARLSSGSRYGGLDWTLVHEQRAADVLGPAGALASELWGIALAATLIVLALGSVLVFSIARRIENLVQVARRFGAGDPDIRADEHGHDELANLASTFNDVSDGLRSASRHAEFEAKRVMALEEDLRLEIAPRLRTEAALQAKLDELRGSEQMFRELLDAAPDAMVITDATGTITMANRSVEEVFGYTMEELLGRPVEVLIPERVRAEHPANYRRYVAAPFTRSMGAGIALSGLRKDGTEFPVEVSLGPIDWADGCVVVAAIRDVTGVRTIERSLAESVAELRRSNRELE